MSEMLNNLKNWFSASLGQETEELTTANFIFPNDDDYEDFGEQTEEWEPTGFASAAEYKGRKVTLNKPFRTPKGPKKKAVYVKNDKGNVVLVRFGDPNMRNRSNDPERKKAFRSRHNCDNPGPKWKAKYWACKDW
jgi:hypothetical protein